MTTPQTQPNTSERGDDDLPIFPAPSPAVLSDREAAAKLFADVFEQLATVVDVPPAVASAPTPCDKFTVVELQRHVLAWLQFFAQALNDPNGETGRIDPDQWSPSEGDNPVAIVHRAAGQFQQAISRVPDGELISMVQARMPKEAVLAMALGEYLTHGWDLSVSTGASWSPSEAAAEPALEFLRATVAPEYRGPGSGFFADEVQPAADASVFEQLLCFCGRDPNWSN